MKKLFFVLVVFVSISFAANAQTTTKKEKKEAPKTELKEHVCTDACHATGHCVYAHGEKGHVCTEDCKKMTSSSEQVELKDHVCTAACKSDKHVYAHGEKGHVCTDDCKKKM
jgi:uncharacterized alpha/beta hydrolase family protein